MAEDEVSTETEVTAPEEVAVPETSETVEATEVEEVAAVEEASEEVAEAEATEEEATDEEATEEVVEEAAEEVESKIDNLEDALAELAKTRKEAADKRVKNRELEEQLAAINEAFGDTGDEYRDGWLAIAQAFAANPDDPEIRAILAELAGVQTGEAAPALDGNAILEQVRSEFAAQQQALDVKKAEDAFILQTKELGYDPAATAEENPVEYTRAKALFAQLAAQPEGERSLETAHAAVKAFEQAIFDRKLAELSAANTGAPVVRGAGAAAVEATEETGSKPSSQRIKDAYAASIAKAEEQASRPLS